MKIFRHRSFIPAPAERVLAFHADPSAIARLTPPLTRIQIVRDARTSLTAGDLEFWLWLGPIPLRWNVRHEPGPIPTSFRDTMLQGPMAHWEHDHIFWPIKGVTELVDKIALAHHPGWRGWLTRMAFDGLSLRTLFTYRHWRTRRAVLLTAGATMGSTHDG